MGIFSIFGKKKIDSRKSIRLMTTIWCASCLEKNSVTQSEGNSTDRFANSQLAQRSAARATARKIDAIESEMTLDILRSNTIPLPELQAVVTGSGKSGAAARKCATGSGLFRGHPTARGVGRRRAVWRCRRSWYRRRRRRGRTVKLGNRAGDRRSGDPVRQRAGCAG
ncbi:hypothetical protein ACFS07_03400 [Undibacterium arcticum]